MKRFFTLLFFVLLLCNMQSYAQFVSGGTGTFYTFESLSQIDTSGVVKSGSEYSVSKDITISSEDTLNVENNITVKLADGVTIYVSGIGIFAPADTAVFTRLDENSSPKGIYFNEDSATTVIKNITFEYGGVKYIKAGSVSITNCSFKEINKLLNYSSALGLGNNTVLVANCSFISNEGAAVNSAANYTCNLTFRDNYLFDNNTSNVNSPQINMSNINEAVTIISGNTIIGTERTMVGGIAVSNMISQTLNAGNVVIEGNTVKKCRYGITTIGPLNVTIKSNILVDNKYDTNPMNGGSGMSLYDPYYKQKVVVTENLITDNYWGITVIGCGDVNIGKTGNPQAVDYNPGLNVFKDNGNNDALYDLYNNSTNTVYAQGNTWNVAVQDAESIESVIFHKPDNAALGEVIYMPDGSGIDAASRDSQACYYDASTKSLILLISENVNVSVYSLSGRFVFGAENQKDIVTLPSGLQKGIYFAKVFDGNKTSVLKFIY